MEEVSVIRTVSPSVPLAVKPSSTPLSRTRFGKTANSGIQADKIPSERDGTTASVSLPFSKKNRSVEVSAVIKDLNQKLEVANNTLRFQIDDTTDEIKVQVVDKETGKVVRTIPPEPSLSILAQGELSGLLSVHG